MDRVGSIYIFKDVLSHGIEGGEELKGTGWPGPRRHKIE